MGIRWFVGLGILAWAGVTSEALAQHDGAQEPQDDVAGIDIECAATNDFGYVALVKGKLELVGLADAYASFTARGDLEVKTWFYDDGEPATAQLVSVQGTITESYLNAEVKSDGTLKSMMLAFQSPMSQVASADGANYQTDCSSSLVKLPQVADLIPLDSLPLSELPDGSQRARVSVLNNGSLAIVGPTVQVRVSGYVVTGMLVQSQGGASTLEPGYEGYVEVVLPAGTLARCTSYEVTVDLDRRLQPGPVDPFSNDTGRQPTSCLRWNTTITEETLGTTPDPLISGKSIAAIVSSEATGRLLNDTPVLCSRCHYVNSKEAPRYFPPSGPITPSQKITIGPPIADRAWNELGGVADRFIVVESKPMHLKQLFRRWQMDGSLQ